MTPEEIRAWADRAEARVKLGLTVSPDEPSRLVVEALRLLADHLAARPQPEEPPAKARAKRP